MTAEHVLTPDDKCPCGKPQTGSGYCSYECYSKHEPEPASMGGPLSEADRPPLPDEEIALMERLWAPHQTYVRDLLDEVYRLRAKAAKAWKEHTEFTDAIGYGNGRTEPSADLADLVEPILQAFSAASDHFECPVYCENCGYQVADKDCESCNGSGCGPRTAEGAYDECEHCAGAGRLHEGCVGKTYAELAAENALLEGQLATAREQFELERVAALIDPEAWRHVDPHSAEFFEELGARAEYEANFAEAVRQRREPSLAAAARVIALFEDARALGLDGGDPDAA